MKKYIVLLKGIFSRHPIRATRFWFHCFSLRRKVAKNTKRMNARDKYVYLIGLVGDKVSNA